MYLIIFLLNSRGSFGDYLNHFTEVWTESPEHQGLLNVKFPLALGS